MRKSCSSCSYRIHDDDDLRCGRYPPRVEPNVHESRIYDGSDETEVVTTFSAGQPIVSELDVCGEYRKEQVE